MLSRISRASRHTRRVVQQTSNKIQVYRHQTSSHRAAYTQRSPVCLPTATVDSLTALLPIDQQLGLGVDMESYPPDVVSATRARRHTHIPTTGSLAALDQPAIHRKYLLGCTLTPPWITLPKRDCFLKANTPLMQNIS